MTAGGCRFLFLSLSPTLSHHRYFGSVGKVKNRSFVTQILLEVKGGGGMRKWPVLREQPQKRRSDQCQQLKLCVKLSLSLVGLSEIYSSIVLPDKSNQDHVLKDEP